MTYEELCRALEPFEVRITRRTDPYGLPPQPDYALALVPRPGWVPPATELPSSSLSGTGNPGVCCLDWQHENLPVRTPGRLEVPIRAVERLVALLDAGRQPWQELPTPRVSAETIQWIQTHPEVPPPRELPEEQGAVVCELARAWASYSSPQAAEWFVNAVYPRVQHVQWLINTRRGYIREGLSSPRNHRSRLLRELGIPTAEPPQARFLVSPEGVTSDTRTSPPVVQTAYAESLAGNLAGNVFDAVRVGDFRPGAYLEQQTEPDNLLVGRALTQATIDDVVQQMTQPHADVSAAIGSSPTVYTIDPNGTDIATRLNGAHLVPTETSVSVVDGVARHRVYLTIAVPAHRSHHVACLPHAVVDPFQGNRVVGTIEWVVRNSSVVHTARVSASAPATLDELHRWLAQAQSANPEPRFSYVRSVRTPDPAPANKPAMSCAQLSEALWLLGARVVGVFQRGKTRLVLERVPDVKKVAALVPSGWDFQEGNDGPVLMGLGQQLSDFEPDDLRRAWLSGTGSFLEKPELVPPSFRAKIGPASSGGLMRDLEWGPAGVVAVVCLGHNADAAIHAVAARMPQGASRLASARYWGPRIEPQSAMGYTERELSTAIAGCDVHEVAARLAARFLKAVCQRYLGHPDLAARLNTYVQFCSDMSDLKEGDSQEDRFYRWCARWDTRMDLLELDDGQRLLKTTALFSRAKPRGELRRMPLDVAAMAAWRKAEESTISEPGSALKALGGDEAAHHLLRRWGGGLSDQDRLALVSRLPAGDKLCSEDALARLAADALPRPAPEPGEPRPDLAHRQERAADMRAGLRELQAELARSRATARAAEPAREPTWLELLEPDEAVDPAPQVAAARAMLEERRQRRAAALTTPKPPPLLEAPPEQPEARPPFPVVDADPNLGEDAWPALVALHSAIEHFRAGERTALGRLN